MLFHQLRSQLDENQEFFKMVCVCLVLFSFAVLSDDEKRILELIDHAESATPVELRAILNELGSFGKKSEIATPLILKLLSDDRNAINAVIPDDTTVAMFAQEALVKIGEPAVAEIVQFLADNSTGES